MASVNIEMIGSGSLAGGATTTKEWKNPPVQKVLGFWVAPKALTANDLFLPGPVSFQITSVTSKMDAPNHFVVDVTVKNTSVITWDFELFMSFLS